MKITFAINPNNTTLKFRNDRDYGLFEPVNWSLSPENDTRKILQRIDATYSDYVHDLCNFTGYGLLLIGYTFIVRRKSDSKHIYYEILKKLLFRCRLPLESYAIWMSIVDEKRNKNEKLEETLLSQNTDYINYFHDVEKLVEHIPSLFLRKWIIGGCMPVCFQSRSLVNYVLSNFTELNFSTINESEFPDSRFNILSKKLPTDALYNYTLSFIETRENANERDILMKAIRGTEDVDLVLEDDYQNIGQEILHWIYDSVCMYFEEIKSKSLRHQDYLDYAPLILSKMDNIDEMHMNDYFPPKEFTTVEDRRKIIELEKKPLILFDTQLPCIFLNVEGQEEQVAWFLGNLNTVNPCIYITACSFESRKAQHIIKREEKEIIDQVEGPFVAIRIMDNIEGELSVLYIPFYSPNLLHNFITDFLYDVPFPIVASISQSILDTENWYHSWAGVFMNHCTCIGILLDTSPISFLHKKIKSEEKISYSELKLNLNHKDYTGMMFKITKKNIYLGTVFFPCSESYSEYLTRYISCNFPEYRHDPNLKKDNDNGIMTVFSYYLWGEHQFSFITNKDEHEQYNNI